MVVTLGGLSKRAELQQASPSPPPEVPPYDQEGIASAALLRDVHSALMIATQKGGLLGESPPAPAPQKAVLYTVEQPPGPIVWPEDVGVQLLNAPPDGSVDGRAQVRFQPPFCKCSFWSSVLGPRLRVKLCRTQISLKSLKFLKHNE